MTLYASLVEWVMSALIIVGGFFSLVGAIGLQRLPDFLSRLHAPTKASTLGVGGVLLAAILEPMRVGAMPVLHVLLLTLFVFISAPVSAQFLASAALRSGAGSALGRKPDEFVEEPASESVPPHRG